MPRTIITNARIVTPVKDFTGSCIVENGIITDISSSIFHDEAIDLNGMWLLPGCIDLHTDQLEHEISPRPNAVFPFDTALHNLDIRAVSSGLTTIFSCIRFSFDPEKIRQNGGDCIEKTNEFAAHAHATCARHYVQARWDTNFNGAEPIIESMKSLERLRLIVLNENIPGNRQFRDMEKLANQWAVRKKITTEEAMAAIKEKAAINSQINNRGLIRDAFSGKLTIGSHDDTTIDHVLEAYEYGSTLSEMPTTIEAAMKARELGMMICMGASNYLRGGSAYDNLSSMEAVEKNCADILCSDYYFPALLSAFLKMVSRGISPSHAASYFTLNPARCVGMDKELGSIEVGKTADLVAFESAVQHSIIRYTWVNGLLAYSLAHPEKVLQTEAMSI